jgi:hypothetical protein
LRIARVHFGNSKHDPVSKTLKKKITMANHREAQTSHNSMNTNEESE